MQRIKGSTIIKLIIASLVVGLVLAWLNVSPQELLRGIIGEAEQMVDNAIGVFGWAFSYILLGAVIVVPIWLLIYLMDSFKKRKGG